LLYKKKLILLPKLGSLKLLKTDSWIACIICSVSSLSLDEIGSSLAGKNRKVAVLFCVLKIFYMTSGARAMALHGLQVERSKEGGPGQVKRIF